MPRLPQIPSKVPDRLVGKLQVKNEVLGGQRDRLSGICIFEMQQLFMCFKKFNFSQEACAKEITGFKSCYNNHILDYKKRQANSQVSPQKEITKLLRKYPERRKS